MFYRTPQPHASALQGGGMPPVINNDFVHRINRLSRESFQRMHLAAEQDRLLERAMLLAMHKSGTLSEAKTSRLGYALKAFMSEVLESYYQFADEARIQDFMRDRLQRQAAEVGDFLNSKNLLRKQLLAQPDMKETDLVLAGINLLTRGAAREPLPLDSAWPFIRHLDSLLPDLEWVDWGMSHQRITTPLQAIHALYAFTFEEGRPALDGKRIGERVAMGARPIDILAPMTFWQKTLLDKAAILYNKAVSPELNFVAGSELPQLAEQLALLRRLFLEGLRESWQLGQMFAAVTPHSRVVSGLGALRNAQGKTFDDLLRDPGLLAIPGVAALPDAARARLLHQKLDRIGEAAEYRFGTLQHAIASVLKRAWLTQGKVLPASFGSEAEMVGTFLTLCQSWDAEPSSSTNPRLLLAQYLAQAAGEDIATGATRQIRIAALAAYLEQRWQANYGAAPARFDRRQAALAILRAAVGNAMSEYELTQQKQEFSTSLTGGLSDVRWQTPLDRFLYVAESLGVNEMMHLHHHAFSPRTELEQAEQRYNQSLRSHGWIQARAREQLRVQGKALTDAALNAELDTLVAAFHTETESDRVLNKLLGLLRQFPLFGNIFRFGEGLVLGNVDEIIGALPVLGNIYELEEGMRHQDGWRIMSALPVIGSAYQLEQAWQDGDTLRVIMSGEALLFDIASVQGPESGMAAHRILDEAELPLPYAVALRNALALSRALKIPLQGFKRDLAPSGTEGPARMFQPGDPFGIERIVSHPELPDSDTGPQPSALGFGPAMDIYQLSPPRPGMAPDSNGIMVDGNQRYIREGGQFYLVSFDKDNQTWRVIFHNNPTKPAIPVRYQDGRWQIHSDVGLKGGALTAVPAMATLFDSNLRDSDRFYAARQAARERYYAGMAYGRKSYEDSFDVEGHIAGHQKMPEVYPGNGQRYFDIRSHGGGGKILSITGQVVGPKVFADEIRHYVKYYRPGTPIRLLVCEAARGGVLSFAQRFANAINAPVRAYTVDVSLRASNQSLARHARNFEPFESAAMRELWS